MLDPLLRHLRDAQLARITIPALTFFEPTPAFFEALEAYRHRTLIDCGAGMGHVSKAAQARGFQMLPIDITRRTGQWDQVQIADAELQLYGADTWPLMCRPDHSGWVHDVIDIALAAGAHALYVGLDRNLELDLGGYVGRELIRVPDVGEEGEQLLVFAPTALLPEDYYD